VDGENDSPVISNGVREVRNSSSPGFLVTSEILCTRRMNKSLQFVSRSLIASYSRLSKTAQFGEEGWIGYGGAVGIEDAGFAGGG
jgi:hypothetical protein